MSFMSYCFTTIPWRRMAFIKSFSIKAYLFHIVFLDVMDDDGTVFMVAVIVKTY